MGSLLQFFDYAVAPSIRVHKDELRFRIHRLELEIRCDEVLLQISQGIQYHRQKKKEIQI